MVAIGRRRVSRFALALGVLLCDGAAPRCLTVTLHAGHVGPVPQLLDRLPSREVPLYLQSCSCICSCICKGCHRAACACHRHKQQPLFIRHGLPVLDISVARDICLKTARSSLLASLRSKSPNLQIEPLLHQGQCTDMHMRP